VKEVSAEFCIELLLSYEEEEKKKKFMKIKILLIIICSLAMLLSACSAGSPGQTITATPVLSRVNGFGTAANHPHSLLAFPDNVLILATHYGTFRSGDDGTNWVQVTGGSSQPMQDLMTYSLTNSLLDQQRFYVLTQPVISAPKGTLGIYRSDNQGRTWQLASTTASLTNGTIYLAKAGNDTTQEVYIYLSQLGAQGLRVSMDAGVHFVATGMLPFGNLTALLPLPGKPGFLLASSSNGMARSTDGGHHWTLLGGISGGIFEIVTGGMQQPIYASGDAGVYASYDSGKTFTLVNSQATYGSLTVSPTQPQVIYGRTGTAVYRSNDGGHSWKLLPVMKGNIFSLEADPNNASQVYLSLSYPAEVYYFKQTTQKWVSLTPKA
jgi:hypothetical protein